MSKYQLLLSKHIAPYCTLEKYRVVREAKIPLTIQPTILIHFWYWLPTSGKINLVVSIPGNPRLG